MSNLQQTMVHHCVALCCSKEGIRHELISGGRNLRIVVGGGGRVPENNKIAKGEYI